MMSWTGLINSSYPEGYIYSQKSHPAIKWLTAPAPSRGQVSTAWWYPSPREGEGGGPQSTIFLRPWHISASCRVILLAWVRKHVSHLYNKWDNFISFSLCSLHYGIASKENFCSLSGLPKMISHWWLTCPHQNYMRLWIHKRLRLPATQAGTRLPSTQAPAMIYHFQMLRLTTNLRSSAFSARSSQVRSCVTTAWLWSLHEGPVSFRHLCLPKMDPMIWTLCSRLPSSFLFNQRASQSPNLKEFTG